METSSSAFTRLTVPAFAAPRRSTGRGLQDVGARGARTHHRTDQGRGIDLGPVGLQHRPSSAQDRDAIRDGEHLGDLVRDQHDGSALLGQGPQEDEEGVHFRGREHRRRLVQHEDRRITQERLEDLHPLTIADAELVHDRVERNGQAGAPHELRRAVTHFGRPQPESRRAGIAPQRQVLHDR